MLDPARLLLLRELADRGTMTAVAAALGHTSSAVSQQLAVLEREAGVPLLERAGRRVRLTPEGVRLVAHARIVLRALETAEHDLRAADTPRGPVAVACFSTFAAVHVVPALVAARERHPELRISLHELEPPEALAALRARRCDIAVRYGYNLIPEPPPEPDEFTRHPLAVDPVLLALPTNPSTDSSAVDLRDLADALWIVGSREDGSAALVRGACALAGFVPRIAHAVDDYHLVLRMVANGLGVALVPQLVAHAQPPGPDVTLRPVLGTQLTRDVHALAHATPGARPAVDAVLALLRPPAP
ncbi:LysR family transcriptional regulator [Kitasatospora misakiensis]|uniref:LysR family transcriptional regulator n=1 Tax=Kitasatospora misakiensis TaxID=67330 RepID=A0ABW0WVK3_9ACTN